MARTRLLAFVTPLLTIALTGSISPPPVGAPAAHGGDRQGHGRYVSLQVLGVNDLHGHLEGGQRLPRGKRPARVGGAAWLAAHLDRAERSHRGPTLRVHAGDMVGASPFVSSHFHDEPTVEAMNLMNFDAGTLGNHEFDEGLSEAMRLVHGGGRDSRAPSGLSRPDFAGSSFPYVAANTLRAEGEGLILPPYSVIERAGVRVGVIGVTTPSTPDFLLARHAARVRFLDISETVNRYTRALQRRGVETIIVLAHAGGFGRAGELGRGEIFNETREMSDEVDLVIAGHSHSVLDARVPNRRGPGAKLVVEADEYGTAYDRAFLTVDRATGDVTDKRASVRRTWNANVDPRPDLSALVAHYTGRSARLGTRVIGHLDARVQGRAGRGLGKSALARLAANAQRSLARADVAFVDPVSVRGGLRPGPVTYADLFEVVPYEHPVLRLEMTGAELAEAVTGQRSGSRHGVRLATSGLRGSGADLRLSSGRRVEAERSYSVAASELLVTSSGSLLRATRPNRRSAGTELEALVAYFAGRSSARTRAKHVRRAVD